MMSEDHIYNVEDDGSIITNAKSTGVSTDAKLMGMLKDLRTR